MNEIDAPNKSSNSYNGRQQPGRILESGAVKNTSRIDTTTVLAVGAGMIALLAAGQMFLSGKMRNIGKVNLNAFKDKPRTRPFVAGGQEHSAGASSSTAAAGTSSRTGVAAAATVPDLLVPHMRTLQLAPTMDNLQAAPLKGAFRKMALTWHPDRAPTAAAGTGAEADRVAAIKKQEFQERFKDIEQSYRFLERHVVTGDGAKKR